MIGINMWDIIYMWNIDEFIKWFRCKMCCQSKCSVGEDTNEEQLEIKYSKRRKSI